MGTYGVGAQSVGGFNGICLALKYSHTSEAETILSEKVFCYT